MLKHVCCKDGHGRLKSLMINEVCKVKIDRCRAYPGKIKMECAVLQGIPFCICLYEERSP